MDEDGRQRVEAVYRAQADRMWRALFGFTGDRDVASDALAEAFARALQNEAVIRDVPGWLWRVSFRLASAEIKRRELPRQGLESPSYELPEPLPELMGALKHLSPNQRLALVLHDYADRPSDEVAEAMGCSRATVRVHLSRGRRRLRTLLEEDHA
ncbi:MAG: sigma factor-like helix-turn-helix DNA-binding protein [Actinomycetota bacterium]